MAALFAGALAAPRAASATAVADTSGSAAGKAAAAQTVTVPDTGQPQATWVEFGAVNHRATLSVDG
ncbi:hypothetical protein ABT084_24810 [Streptomyces sp. NPDC002138]|uniref:hypothetical protein n=1 Tax=Streptomyces sp. NPDC002138 TaxID=3154410 RepID=UPI0033230D7D